ncbi:MAG: selenocysteine-specific translation elongation factor [Myxococcales bacterium]|nr:selenocysteine-specific translation elongation factor [Myxococcales bacterium]
MLIIGTAGHIDHGKTSLVRALTGIETDRLKEEQARGISIELGFAWMDVGGLRCGIVDVPGHERFIRQMIAGATGIDLVMLVIAADEGVMQQTREHLDVCRLLGISSGFVVLSKIDLVDPEWLELVKADVATFVSGTFLEGAPVLEVTLLPGSGGGATQATTAIRSEIERQAPAAGERRRRAATLPFRLPVDRVFTMRGFGTVVTGTVASGNVDVGDAVTLQPSGAAAKVRGIESHGDAVHSAVGGHRAAVNLQGLDRESVDRGEVLTRPGSFTPSHLLDVDLHFLAHAGKILETGAKALVHLGTTQVTGTIVLLGADAMEPGETRPAQLRLDRPVVAMAGDRVVLRGFEQLAHYGTTFGGATVRHPTPLKHKAGDTEVLATISTLAGDDMTAKLRVVTVDAGLFGYDERQFTQILGAPGSEIAEGLAALTATAQLFRVQEGGTDRYVHASHFDALCDKAETLLASHHERSPHRPGMPLGELRSQLRYDLSPRLFAEIIAVLAARGRVVAEQRWVRRIDFTPRLSAAMASARERGLTLLRAAGLATPSLVELGDQLRGTGTTPSAQDVAEVVELLVEEGLVVKVDGLLFHKEAIDGLAQAVRTWFEGHETLNTTEFKELTGASRKYSVPLAEYLDSLKLTARYGDVRKRR